MKMNYIGSLCLVALLTACGGGGGGGGSSEPPITASSSSIANTIVANAGADITVNEGEKVNLNPVVVVVNPTGFTSGGGNLEITGSSTKASDIVKLKWTLQKGVLSGISTTDTTSGRFSFVAPDTGSNVSAEIIYQLTLTNAAGQTASDSITITINRVNEAPVATAGVDQSAESGAIISLSAAGSSDPDGTIKSYAWLQTEGDAVTLTDADKSTANFTAPVVNEAKTYEFELTVTDNNDATAKDKIVVTITPKDAPLLTIYFPAPVGVYKEATISAFGSAEAVNANLSKVEVSTGGDFTEAALSDGKWRLDNIAVPTTDTFEVVVKVTDSLGKISTKKSMLKKSGSQGAGQPWTKIIALGIDNKKQRVFVFAKGTNLILNDVRVFPIALSSGNRGSDLSNFFQSNQGVQSSAIAQACYDKNAASFFYTLNPADASINVQVNQVSVINGQRKVITENAQSLISPPPLSFVNPIGIACNQQGQLFVADNSADAIIQLDSSSGVRKEITKLDAAIGLAIDPGHSNKLFAVAWSNLTRVVSASLDVNPVSLTTITDSINSIQGPGIGSTEFIEADVSLNKLLLVDSANQLFEVDITAGLRTKIDSVSVAGKGYDHERHLFYYNEKTKNAIWVLDPVSKHKVMISGSSD